MLTTYQLWKLREPKSLAVPAINAHDLPRFAAAATLKAVDAYNGRVETHGKKLADFTATLTALNAGNVEGEPVKLAKELGLSRVELAGEAVKLHTSRITLRDELRAEFAKWKQGASALYHSSKKTLAEQALAVAGGRVVLAEQIAENHPKLTELQSDSYWEGPEILHSGQTWSRGESRVVLALAITDTCGLTDANQWPKTMNVEND